MRFMSENVARQLGLNLDQVHGDDSLWQSRAPDTQVYDDCVKVMLRAMNKYG